VKGRGRRGFKYNGNKIKKTDTQSSENVKNGEILYWKQRRRTERSVRRRIVLINFIRYLEQLVACRYNFVYLLGGKCVISNITLTCSWIRGTGKV